MSESALPSGLPSLLDEVMAPSPVNAPNELDDMATPPNSNKTDDLIVELVNTANDIDELKDKLSIISNLPNFKPTPMLHLVLDTIQNGDTLPDIRKELSEIK
jgi:hypothetical protein